MQKYKRMRRFVFAFAALLSFLMAGSSWAYWTQELLTTNEYRLAAYDTSIVEVFESPGDWRPGVDVNKDVRIKNDGTLPVYVKVVLNQKWVRTENVYDLNGNIVFPAKGDAFPLIFDGSGGKEYAAQITWGSNVVLLASGKTAVPSLSLGLPTVNTVKEAADKWLLISETPDANGEYTLYYIGTLASGKTTPLVIDSVRMNGNIRATILEDNTVWNKKNQQWITTSTNNQTYSYENARYTLSVTMHTVQATKDALIETFKADSTVEQAVISQLSSFAHTAGDINFSYDDTVKLHKLYFEELNGKISFTPVRGSGEYWFMSDLNMVPGGTYEHSLLIENRSKKIYDLYMQVIPLSQPSRLNELLEYISMKVYYGTELIYDGTAMGKAYVGSINNLQNVILLGTYAPGLEKQIHVELLLDKDTPIEYANLLTKIDWKFMAEERIEPTPTATLTPVASPTPAQSSNPSGPKTGDDGGSGRWYILVMSLGGLCLAGCIVFLITTGKKRKYALCNGFENEP